MKYKKMYAAILTFGVFTMFFLQSCKHDVKTSANHINSNVISSSKTSSDPHTSFSQNDDSSNSSTSKPKIINVIDKSIKNSNQDIFITNEWIGEKCTEYQYIVLFGSLPKDRFQGVAKVIRINPQDGKTIEEKTYLDPEGKHGALRVVELGAKSNDMSVINGDGKQYIFFYSTGFQLP